MDGYLNVYVLYYSYSLYFIHTYIPLNVGMHARPTYLEKEKGIRLIVAIRFAPLTQINAHYMPALIRIFKFKFKTNAFRRPG